MPELPEVETVVSDLNEKIKGDTIVGFWSGWKKAIKRPGFSAFKKQIVGRKILGARRHGKNIFIDLSGGKTLYIHLKMTGHLLVKNFEFRISNFESISNDAISNDQGYFDDKVNQYIHHRWFLNSGIKNSKFNQNSKFKIKNYDKSLEFSDLRKFGKILLVDTDKLYEVKELGELGIDALDAGLTLERFDGILGKYGKKKIRDILMDQNIIAGIGNIYVSEILFDAGILPMRPASDMNAEERKKLYQSIKKTLKKAIRLRGTSDSDYRDTAGAPGGFQKVLKVYRREGEKCKTCVTPIKRVKMGQRSIFYCSHCQK